MDKAEYMREYRKKNKEKMRETDRRRYQKRKQDPNYTKKQKEISRKWYQSNKESIAKRRKQDYKNETGTFENKDEMILKAKYCTNKWRKKPEVIERSKKQRKERYEGRKDLMNEIQIHYGCMSPNCKWNDEYKICDLDFHHVDPKNKNAQVSQMASCSLKKIVEEINRCVVLCAICHRRIHAGEENAKTDVCLVELVEGKIIYCD